MLDKLAKRNIIHKQSSEHQVGPPTPRELALTTFSENWEKGCLWGGLFLCLVGYTRLTHDSSNSVRMLQANIMHMPLHGLCATDRPAKILLRGPHALTDAECSYCWAADGWEARLGTATRILDGVERSLFELGKRSPQRLMEFEGVGEVKLLICAALELARRRRDAPPLQRTVVRGSCRPLKRVATRWKTCKWSASCAAHGPRQPHHSPASAHLRRSLGHGCRPQTGLPSRTRAPG